MQAGLDIVNDFLQETGLSQSSKKTVYVVVASRIQHRTGKADLITLHMGGTGYNGSRTPEFWDFPIDEDGGAKT